MISFLCVFITLTYVCFVFDFDLYLLDRRMGSSSCFVVTLIPINWQVRKSFMNKLASVKKYSTFIITRIKTYCCHPKKYLKLIVLFISSVKSEPNLKNLGNIRYWPKRAPKISPHQSIYFLSVLHQKKALHNFHKRGQLPITGFIKGLD